MRKTSTKEKGVNVSSLLWTWGKENEANWPGRKTTKTREKSEKINVV